MEAVKAVGLDAWIKKQLHPATLDDSALEQRLEQFPAMHLTEEELTRKFPPGSVIRQVENGKISVPMFNATERAIYENQVIADKKKQEQDKAKAANPNLALPPATVPRRPFCLPTGSGGAAEPPSCSADGEVAVASGGGVRPIAPPTQPAQRNALDDGMSPQQHETLIALDNPRQLVQSELLQSRVVRAVYSQRQLQEVMTDFWLNHFNIFQAKTGEEIYSLVPYERDVIRPNAFGQLRGAA